MAKFGTNGDDFFSSNGFAEEIFGLGGNDTIRGSQGADTIDGGQGSDTVWYSTYYVANIPLAGKAVDVDLARQIQHGGLAEGDVLIGVENITGSAFDDVIRGDAAANELRGHSGSDVLEGRGGDDLLFGDDVLAYDITGPTEDDDHLDGGSGDDQLFGDGGNDTLIGGDHNDRLAGGDGSDLLNGGAGIDALDGGAGIDTAIFDTAITVSLAAGTASDGTSTDVLFGIENVTGSDLADQLFGNSGVNVLDGGSGADTLEGGGGADRLNGGGGGDTASYTLSNSAVFIDLAAAAVSGGDANGDILTAIENLTGSAFGDLLFGDGGANIIKGGAGNDSLKGAGGADALDGGSGSDILSGGQGIDTLIGGSDADTFAWRATNETGASAGNADTIVDFNPADGDRVDLSQIDANIIAAGNQAFTFIGQAAFSGAPGEVNFVHLNGDTIIQLQTGVEADADAAIRIPGLINLNAGMFIL